MMPLGIDAFLGTTSCAPGNGRAAKWKEGYLGLDWLRPVDAG